MSSSYFALAQVVESLWRSEQGGRYATLDDLAALTRRVEPQIVVLLSELEANGMVSKKGEHWSLSPQGRSWASDLAGNILHAKTDHRKAFKSFLDYRPTEWWPNGK